MTEQPPAQCKHRIVVCVVLLVFTALVILTVELTCVLFELNVASLSSAEGCTTALVLPILGFGAIVVGIAMYCYQRYETETAEEVLSAHSF